MTKEQEGPLETETLRSVWQEACTASVSHKGVPVTDDLAFRVETLTLCKDLTHVQKQTVQCNG